jgi:hypothetical protein
MKENFNNPPRENLQDYRDKLAKKLKEGRKEYPNDKTNYTEEDRHTAFNAKYNSDPYYESQDNKFLPGEDISRLEKRIRNIVLSKTLHESGGSRHSSKILFVKNLLGNTPEKLFSLEEKEFIIKNLFPGGRFYGDETYADYNLNTHDHTKEEDYDMGEKDRKIKKNLNEALGNHEFLKTLSISDQDVHKIEGMDNFLNDKKSKMFDEKEDLRNTIKVLADIDEKFGEGKFSEVDKEFAIKAFKKVMESFSEKARNIELVINKDVSVDEGYFAIKNFDGSVEKDEIIKIIENMDVSKFDIGYKYYGSYTYRQNQGREGFILKCIPLEESKIGLINILDKEKIIGMVKTRYERSNNAGTLRDDIRAVEIFDDKVIALEHYFRRDTGSGGSGHYFDERHGFISSKDQANIIIRMLNKNLKEIKSVELPVENSEAEDSVKSKNRKNDIEKIISLEGDSVKVSNKEGEIFTVELKNLKN